MTTVNDKWDADYARIGAMLDAAQPGVERPFKLGELDGVSFSLVDGNSAAIAIKDFIGGGNWKAYPGVVPDKTIWIDDRQDAKTRRFCAFHEWVETQDWRGEFQPSHDNANDVERQYREAEQPKDSKGAMILMLSTDAYGREESDEPMVYRKEFIRVGNYYKQADDQHFEVTGDRIQHWVDTFKVMRAAGRVTKLVASHAGRADPNAVLGDILAIIRQGSSAIFVVKFHGEKERDIALKNGVSLWTEPLIVDDKKNVYPDAIDHIAAVPNPVIQGLENYVPIAASNDSTQNVPILRLDNRPAAQAPIEEKTMADAPRTVSVNEDQALKLMALAGGGADGTNIGDRIVAKVTSLQDVVTGVKQYQLALSRSSTPPQTAQAIQLFELKIENLIAKGKLAPNVAELFRKKYLGAEQVGLRLANNPTAAQINPMEFLELLDLNEGLHLSQLTGPQADAPILPDPMKAKRKRKWTASGITRNEELARQGNPDAIAARETYPTM